ncbi:MAG: hypothetical protein J6S67_22025 [Methanobrevibacter sp.]|nr:hypothetical protein [Methanobrevibacter sp.]
MARVSKKDLVLSYLKEYHSITSWEAIKNFKATRLSAIIFDLRAEGYEINSVREENIETGTNYVRYFLISEPH